MGVVAFSADQAFAQAAQNLQEKEYIAAIRNLNHVLNQMPKLDQKRFLTTQYMLGIAYGELRQMPRAGRAWLRYLASYITQNGDDAVRMIEVVRRLLLIQEQLDFTQRNQLQRSLADIVALPLPIEIHAEISLLAAISALHGHQNQLAESWLERARDKSQSPRIKAEAKFYLGFNAMLQGQEASAEKLWLDVAETSEESLMMVRDLAILNLGRLFAAKKMPKLAMHWYEKVKAPGAISRMAAFETTLLAAQMEDFETAVRLANAYISNYPTTIEAFQLQEKLPLLLYQSGKIELAESDLYKRDQTLTNLHNWLERSTRGNLAFNAQDLKRVTERTKIYALESPIIDTSQQLFERLNRLEHAQEEHRNELRSMMLTIGRSLDAHIRPRVVASNQQIKQIISEWAKLGEILLSSEQSLYQAQMTPAEKLSIERSQARRIKLQDYSNELQRGTWRDWQDLTSTSIHLGQLGRKLQQQRSELAGILFNSQRPNARQLSHFASQSLDLQQRTDYLQQRADSLIERIREQMILQTNKDSPYLMSRKQLLLYAQEFIDAEAIFLKMQESYEHPLKRHNQEDLRQAWLSWRSIASQLLAHIKLLDAKEKSWLETQLLTFKQLNQKSTTLADERTALEHKLAILTGKTWPNILEDLSYHIKDQQSRTKKWLADLQWQRSMNQSKKRQEKKLDNDRQETDIKENLKDLELEGALRD